MTPPDRSQLQTTSLVRQFGLARSRGALPEGWTSRSRAGWHLVTHPRRPLPIQPVRAEDEEVGWLIGYPFDDEQGLLRCGLTVAVRSDAPDLEAAVEDALYALGGRYAAVILAAGFERLYLDPCGSLAAIYSRRARIAASTPSMVPDGEEPEPDPEHAAMVAALDLPRSDHWYPFGLTSRVDVQRLTPNHYLDLRAWEQRRHWPSRPLEPVADADVARTIDAITSRIGNLIGHATCAGAVSMTLTAGRDSRMLAACARPHTDEVVFTTTRHPDRAGRMDGRIASLLARRHDLRHELLEWRDASREELDLWQYRTGHGLAGRTWEAVRSERQHWHGAFHVTGHGGEVGRAFYWRDADLARDEASAGELVRRLHLPAVEPILTRADAWRRGLTDHDLPTVLDLLYLEQRVGCWASLMFYGHVGPTSYILPFNHRETIHGLLSLPAKFRHADGLAESVIGRCWPELLEIPFNEFLGLEAKVDAGLAPVRRFLNDHPRLVRLLTLDASS